MAQDAAQIRVGANGNVYVAPVDTTAPTSEVSSLAGGFIDLGFTTDDGVKFKDSKTVRDQTVWQSFYPVGKKVTARDFMISFSLKQWNKSTVPFAFGGGTVTTVTAGHYKFTPPDPEDVDYRAMVIDWQDGDYHYRLYLPRGLSTEDVEVALVRTDDATLAIGFSATPASSSTAPYLLFTDDPAFA